MFTRKEILSNCFTLIREHPQDISDSEKIFVIKLARCYVSEAVERDQSYKLGVDRWSADYYTDDQSGHPL